MEHVANKKTKTKGKASDSLTKRASTVLDNDINCAVSTDTAKTTATTPTWNLGMYSSFEFGP
jgi:hypothetical protein